MNQQADKSSTCPEAHTYYGGQGEPNTLSEVSDIATDLQGKLPGVATKAERIFAVTPQFSHMLWCNRTIKLTLAS
jgi:hypothetical protein